LTDTLLLEAYEWVIEQEGDAKHLLLGDTGDALVAAMSLRG
jgi:exosome complex component RRP4